MESLNMTDRQFEEAERFYESVVCGRLADEWFGVTGEEAEIYDEDGADCTE